MPKVSKQSASHVDDHDRVSGHLLTVLFKNGTRLAGKKRQTFSIEGETKFRHQRPAGGPTGVQCRTMARYNRR